MQEAQTGWMFHVFVSFRTEDTGKNFTDHLYTALDKKGIVTFRYDQALERGKPISTEIQKSIRESRFSIVVFSRSYACSNRCLDELVQILECMKSKGQTVFPVFYDVDPSDVRKQRGCFEKAFCEHEQYFKDKVGSWRAAMKEAANLSGWDLKNKYQSIVIQEIAEKIFNQLSQEVSSAPKDLVGIDSLVKEMNLYLDTGVDDVRITGICGEKGIGIDTGVDDVRITGICGEKGIGKTTIAQVVFDSLSVQFDDSSFLANIKEVSEKQGLVPLQEQLISEILMARNMKIRNVHGGVNTIRNSL